MTVDPNIQALLGGLAETGFAGWNLAEVHRHRTVELVFARHEGRFVLWIAPLDLDTAFYRRTGRFKLGYRGEPPHPSAMALLDHVCTRVAEAERRLPEEALRNIFRVTTDVENLRPHNRELELRVTSRCNESCPFCNSFPYVENRLDTPESVVAAIGRAKALGLDGIVITGGEPTLMPDLPTWVSRAKAMGLHVVLQTNGVRCAEPSFWDPFQRPDRTPALPDLLFVSFHTQHAARLKTLTGVGGTFRRKVKAVQTALCLGMGVTLNFVISTLNLDEFPDFPEFAAATFGNRISIEVSVVAPTGRAAQATELIPQVQAVAPALRAGLHRARQLGIEAWVPEECGVPICVAPDCSRHFRASIRPEPVGPLAPDRVKFPFCADCAHNTRCIGVWRAYVELHGPQGFAPVRD